MINLKLFLIILVLFFQGCDNFKRFGQEKYTCLDNNLSIYQIDIIKTSSIKQAYMITNEGEIPLKIDSLGRREILLSAGNLTININKDNNEISINNENKIHFLKCKSETFNM